MQRFALYSAVGVNIAPYSKPIILPRCLDSSVVGEFGLLFDS